MELPHLQECIVCDSRITLISTTKSRDHEAPESYRDKRGNVHLHDKNVKIARYACIDVNSHFSQYWNIGPDACTSPSCTYGRDFSKILIDVKSSEDDRGLDDLREIVKWQKPAYKQGMTYLCTYLYNNRENPASRGSHGSDHRSDDPCLWKLTRIDVYLIGEMVPGLSTYQVTILQYDHCHFDIDFDTEPTLICTVALTESMDKSLLLEYKTTINRYLTDFADQRPLAPALRESYVKQFTKLIKDLRISTALPEQADECCHVGRRKKANGRRNRN